MSALIVADMVWHPLVPEGAGNRQRILALAADTSVVAAHLLAPGPAPAGYAERFIEVRPWVPRPTPPWFNPGVVGFLHPAAAARMKKAAIGLHPDLVVSEGLWTVPAARAAARGRCPLVVTVNNLEHVVLSLRNRRGWAAAVRAMERAWYRHADLLIAVSEEDGHRLAHVLGRRCPPIAFVPNGVDIPPANVTPASLPHPNVVFLGKTDYPPNADAIRRLEEEWLPAAHAHGMPLSAVVVGGPARPSARERVVFTGYVDDVWPLLAAADVCVAPLVAGSGTRLKVLTYLAAGRPVVATHVAVEGLGVEEGVHYLRAEDGEAFVRALERLRDEPGLAAALRAHGMAWAQRLTWSSMRTRWSGILSSLVRSGRGRA